MAKLVFNDGLELDNVSFDNGVYSCPTEVTNEMLNPEALKSVIFTPDEGEPEIIRFAKTDIVYRGEDDGYHFVLVGESPEQIKIRELTDALNALIGG